MIAKIKMTDMKKKLQKTGYILATGMICLLLQACPKKPEPPKGSPQYTMQFNLVASGNPITIDNTVATGPTHYYIDIMRFYCGLPTLVKTDGTLVPLANLEVVKFDEKIPDNIVCNKTFTFNVPAGDYKGIRFGIGIPPAIRDTVKTWHLSNPVDPLNDFGLIWSMGSIQQKNIFRDIAMDFFVDTSKAQTASPTRFVEWHVIEDDTTLNLYSTLEFQESFSVGNGDNHVTNINIDANTLFFNSASPFDLKTVGTTSMTHGNPNEIQLGIAVNKNFYAAVSKP